MTTIARLVDACPAFAEALLAYDMASLQGDEGAMAAAWKQATDVAAAFRQGVRYACNIQESNIRELLAGHEEFNALQETLRGVTQEMRSALGAERPHNFVVERASSAGNES